MLLWINVVPPERLLILVSRKITSHNWALFSHLCKDNRGEWDENVRVTPPPWTLLLQPANFTHSILHEQPCGGSDSAAEPQPLRSSRDPLLGQERRKLSGASMIWSCYVILTAFTSIFTLITPMAPYHPPNPHPLHGNSLSKDHGTKKSNRQRKLLNT